MTVTKTAVAKASPAEPDKPWQYLEEARVRTREEFETVYQAALGFVSLENLLDRMSGPDRIYIVDRSGREIYKGYQGNREQIRAEWDRAVCGIGLHVVKTPVDERGFEITNMKWHLENSKYEPVLQTQYYFKITVE